MTKLSHLNSDNKPTMVDVSGKQVTKRIAHARALVYLPPEVAAKLEAGEIKTAKGPVFQTAVIAGTMASKQTSDLVPFCHPLNLEKCKIKIEMNDNAEAVIDCVVSVHHRTGVEMEALTGASVAALTIYDMCKGLSHDIEIRSTRLIEKQGGKSDYKRQS